MTKTLDGSTLRLIVSVFPATAYFVDALPHMTASSFVCHVVSVPVSANYLLMKATIVAGTSEQFVDCWLVFS